MNGTVLYDRVFVIATTVDETRHALEVAQVLAVCAREPVNGGAAIVRAHDRQLGTGQRP